MKLRWDLVAAVAALAVMAAAPLSAADAPARPEDVAAKPDEVAAKAGSPLRKALSGVLAGHARMKAAEASVAASKENVGYEWGAWYPKLSVTAYGGHERQMKGQGVADTHMAARSVDASVTQKLVDFGGTSASIDKAELTADQAKENFDAVRQKLIFDGLQAYLEVVKAYKQLDFARGSEENVKRQTELEDALVQKGAGYSTDVLQAKTQLAEARTRRVQAEGALRVATNKYRNIFGAAPLDLDKMTPPRVPFELLPDSSDKVIDIAQKAHPQLKSAYLDTEIAKQNVKASYASNYAPKINGVAQSKWKENDAGTIGGKTEQIVKVEMTYDFNLGFTSLNSIRAAEFTQDGAASRYLDLRGSIEEQSRTAWDNLMTARENAEHFRNMANIAAEYLSLARKERQLGRRSLIDVLAGETSLINANSDAASAEMDVAVAAYTLLLMMGQLDIGVIE